MKGGGGGKILAFSPVIELLTRGSTIGNEVNVLEVNDPDKLIKILENVP